MDTRKHLAAEKKRWSAPARIFHARQNEPVVMIRVGYPATDLNLKP